MKKNLAIVTNSLYLFRGGERLALEIASRVKGRFDVKIANPVSKLDSVRAKRKDLLKMYSMKDSEIVDLDAYGLGMKALGTEAFLMRILKPSGMGKMFDIVRSSDVIYQMSLNPFVIFYAVSLAKLFHKRFVLGVHNFMVAKILENEGGIFQRFKNVLYKTLVLRRIGAFHVTNSRDREALSKAFPEAEVKQIPNFVTRKIGVIKNNSTKFIVLFVGTLEKYQRGVDLLCEIIDDVLGREKGVLFYIRANGGDGEGLVEDLIKRHPDGVKKLGFMTNKELDAMYDSSSLLISTSRFETFPLTILEAQSHGMPMVAYNISGPKDAMKNAIQGELIKPFETKAFAETILAHYRVWKSKKPQFLKQKREIATLINNEYSATAIIPRIEDMLEAKTGTNA